MWQNAARLHAGPPAAICRIPSRHKRIMLGGDPDLIMKTSHIPLIISTAFAAFTIHAGAASSLISGGATIDYDAAAWATLAGGLNVSGFEALVLNEYFDQAGVTARTGTELLTDEIVANPSTIGLYHALNGPSVTNLAGRTNQPTDFAYNPGSLTSHTGTIGLGGVSRWDVNPLLGGGVLGFGDFTLQYESSRLALGGSGWSLRVFLTGGGGNVAFDLLNVVTNATETSLSISGDLAVSPEVAFGLLQTPGDSGKDVGDFNFTATAIPEPSSVLIGGVALLGWMGRRRRNP
jgi:hypothetical protein